MTRIRRAVLRIRHSDVAHSTLVNYVGVVVAAVGSVIVARTLGPEGRGQFAAIMAWFSFAVVLGELGQSGAITHWVARRPDRARSIVTNGRLVTLIASVVIACAGVMCASFLADGDPTLTTAYWIAFAGCFFNGFWGPYVYAAQGVSIRSWNFIRVMQPLTYVATISLFFLTETLNIVTLSVALVGSTAIQLLIARLVAIRLSLGGGRLHKKELGVLSRYGGAYSVSQVTGTVSAQYDKAFLSQTVSDNALGQYAVAGTVAALGGPLSTAIASVAFPRLSVGASRREDRVRAETRLIKLTGAVTLGIILIISAAAAFVVPWIFGMDFTPAVGLVWLLAPAMWAKALTEIVLVFIRSRGRPGLVTWARIAGVSVGAVTILPLVEWLGVSGAALSLLSLEIVTLFVSLYLLRKLRKTGVNNPTQVKG